MRLIAENNSDTDSDSESEIYVNDSGMGSARQSATFCPVAGCRQSSTTLPETKTPSKKVMMTVWWSSAGLIRATAVIFKPFQLTEPVELEGAFVSNKS
ncbi:hypothetical protein TNCV_465551 [Trichonephila clavipes]|nr:hypothetical protein TNCV_465551 [Trichonephila clavipes]